MPPIKVIFSFRKIAAKKIVTTGIRYNPVEIFTVPKIVQALFQATKQTPLAKIPKNPSKIQLNKDENRTMFKSFDNSTYAGASGLFAITPQIKSGIIKTNE